MKSDLLDLEMHLHTQTEKAVLVSDTGERKNAVWLPKSQIEFIEQGRGMVLVTAPEWLAKDKGLI